MSQEPMNITTQTTAGRKRRRLAIFSFLGLWLTVFVCLPVNCNRISMNEPGVCENRLRQIQEKLAEVRLRLLDFRSEKGRFPTNDEGLAALRGKPEDFLSLQQWQQREIRLIKSNAGILSPWLVPYEYENRIGLPKDMFKDSPVNADPGRHYSIEVDRDIYVYSVGAMVTYHEYNWSVAEDWLIRAATVLLIVIFGVLFVRSLKGTPLPTIVASVIVLVFTAILVAPSCIHTCYLAVRFSLKRRAEYLPRYLEQLDKYCKAGVIKEETYRKIKAALDEDTKKLEAAANR